MESLFFRVAEDEPTSVISENFAFPIRDRWGTEKQLFQDDSSIVHDGSKKQEGSFADTSMLPILFLFGLLLLFVAERGE